jgi:hypothetical protein
MIHPNAVELFTRFVRLNERIPPDDPALCDVLDGYDKAAIYYAEQDAKRDARDTGSS